MTKEWLEESASKNTLANWTEYQLKSDDDDSDSDSAEEPARKKQVAHRGSHPTTKAANKNSEIIETRKSTKSKSKKDNNITEKEKSRKGSPTYTYIHIWHCI